MSPEEVSAARHELGLTVTEMAEALRLSKPNGRTTVREWENGRRQISGPASVAIELMLRLHRRTIDPLDLIDAMCLQDSELHGSQQGYLDIDNPESAVLDCRAVNFVRIAEILNDILESAS